MELTNFDVSKLTIMRFSFLGQSKAQVTLVPPSKTEIVKSEFRNKILVTSDRTTERNNGYIALARQLNQQLDLFVAVYKFFFYLILTVFAI